MTVKLFKFILFFSILTFSAVAQKKVIKLTKEDYSRLKEEGKIDYNTYNYEIEFERNAPANKTKAVNKNKTNPGNNNTYGGSIACNIIDQSTVPPFSFGGDIEVDDDSYLVNINFNFCFYGNNYGEFYLNSNGNITFDAAFTGFTASGFPTTGPKMIAPFWADFDNRPNNNGVARLYLTSTYAIVTWDSMGYYSQQSNLRNTCQLIITNGTDPILPIGTNVGFLYENMDWTTGSASGGTAGFGGTAATVGINQGDGATYIQVGRFDSPGGAYVNNVATNSGIDWLDNKAFFFNTCTANGSTNLPPSPMNFDFCNVIKICGLNDTLILPDNFISPEPAQTNTITVSSATLPASNLTVISSTPGVTSNIQVRIVASPALVGTHIIDYRSIDNGTPPETTIVSRTVEIIDDPSFMPSFVIPAAPVCVSNAPVTVSLANCATDYQTPVWSDGTTGCSHTYSTAGLHKLQLNVIGNNGCYKTMFDSLKIYPNPVPTISGSLFYCGAGSTNLTANVAAIPNIPGLTPPSVVTNYTWTVAGSTNSPVANVSAPGPVTVTVTTNNGCTGSATVNVTNATPVITISQNPATYCPGVPVTLTASIAGATSYTWGGLASGTAQATTVTAAAGSATLSAVVSGCATNASITMVPLSAVSLNFTDSVFCANEDFVIHGITNPANATFSWSPGPNVTDSVVATPGQQYTVTVNAGGVCQTTKTITAYSNPLPNIGSIVDAEVDPYDTILCYKDFKHLTANQVTGNGPFTYAWTPSSSSNDTLRITQPGEYFLNVTDANGCKDKDSITILLKQPTLSLTGNPLICRGEDTARIVALGNTNAYGNTYTLSWSPASIGSTDIHGIDDTVYVYSASTYTATITDDVYGCQVSQTYIVNNYPEPNAYFIDEPDSVSEWQVPVLFQNASTITGGTASVYSWYFGDGDTTYGGNLQIHDYAAPGNYPVTLIIKSNKGCFDTVVVNHLVEVHLPPINIMTPNGDAMNQKLSFKGLEFFGEKKITIFNRWGKKVYEKENYMNDWDGDGLEAGTYYYILEVKGHRPESVITNFFQLIR